MLHLHLQNENEQRPVQKSPFRNRSRCMRKRGVYDAVGAVVFAGDSACCWMLVTVLLDAAAPGGASSNRRLGVDTAPGAPPHQPPLPRVIRHPIGRSRTGLRPPWVKRERERERAGRFEELKIKGGSCPGPRLHTRLQCRGLWSRIFTTPSFSH